MATQKRNALGRGLDALLSMDDVKTEVLLPLVK
mgnify:CR=1 FL=1